MKSSEIKKIKEQVVKYLQERNHLEAIEYLNQNIKNQIQTGSPDPSLYLYLGKVYLDKNQLESAQLSLTIARDCIEKRVNPEAYHEIQLEIAHLLREVSTQLEINNLDLDDDQPIRLEGYDDLDTNPSLDSFEIEESTSSTKDSEIEQLDLDIEIDLK